jgi:adenylate cyclase
MAPEHLVEWILTEGPRCRDSVEVFDHVVPKMAEVGLPMLRVWYSVLILHPQAEVAGVIWKDGKAIRQSEAHGFLKSLADKAIDAPPARIMAGEKEYRARLTGETLEYPVLDDMKALGGTDYWLALGVPSRASSSLQEMVDTVGGIGSMISWTTGKEGGWSELDMQGLKQIHQALCAVLGIHAERETGQSLLRAYLGQDAGDRVLAGNVQRGDVEKIRAAVVFTDLRDFTEKSERLSPPDLMAWLNDAFEALVPAIEDAGGHVLQFMGDGMLAIFRAKDGVGEKACTAALDAIHAVEKNLAATNKKRISENLEPIAFGAALHYGEISYGNFGAPNRLAFTVNGPTVNQAARLESLGAELNIFPVLSGEFAQRCGMEVRHISTRDAKGVEGLEVWALKGNSRD